MAFCKDLIKYHHICWYVEYLVRQNMAPASISNAVSHLRTFYAMSALPTSPLTHLRVQLALWAVSTSIRHESNPKEAVTPAILKAAMAQVARLPHPRPVKLALLLMFMGFRQSTVAPSSTSAFDHTRHLTVADVLITPL